jgi:hypothetical protein
MDYSGVVGEYGELSLPYSRLSVKVTSYWSLVAWGIVRVIGLYTLPKSSTSMAFGLRTLSKTIPHSSLQPGVSR